MLSVLTGTVKEHLLDSVQPCLLVVLQLKKTSKLVYAV